MLSDKLFQLSQEVEAELHQNILPFWIKMRDKEHGGFYGRVTGKNVLEPEAPKGSVLNARILWTFSSAAIHFPEKKVYREMADEAFDYFTRYFFDQCNGGIFWMLDYKGSPVDKKKQIYAQAFAIYALAEYYRATAKEESLQLAMHLFQLIEIHSFDPEKNGYFEAYSEDWYLLDDLRLSDKDANEKKTMNTHLHVLEAYTALYKVWKNKHLKKQLVNLVEVFLNKIIDLETGHFNLFFDESWLIKSHEISFGHDIEGSWLLWEAAEASESEELKEKAKHLVIKMAEVTLKGGVDTDGGLFNEGEGNIIVDSDKHWWPQAEAMVGFFNAWQLTKQEAYLRASQNSWNFIKRNMIDRAHGEWFWKTSREGIPSLEEDKAGFWKCPYHNGRACLEMIERIRHTVDDSQSLGI